MMVTTCTGCGASVFFNDGTVVSVGDTNPTGNGSQQTGQTSGQSAGQTSDSTGTQSGNAANKNELLVEGGTDASDPENSDGSDPYITGGDVSPYYVDPNADTGTSDSNDTDTSVNQSSSGGTVTGELGTDDDTTTGDPTQGRKLTDLYVATYGSDDNDGSIDHPYFTIQKALDTISPGHTVFVMSGIYYGANKFTNSGTPESPIKVTAMPGDSVTVSLGRGESGAIFDINGQSNIDIQDFKIGYSYADWVYGILMSNNEHNINIERNEFCNISTTASPGWGGAYAILAYGTGATEETAISDVTIYNNKVHNLYTGYSEAIAASGNVNNIHIIGNIVNEISNIGIDLYGGGDYSSNDPLDQPRNCEIKGNTVYQCVSPFGSCAGIYVDGSKDSSVEDNYVYECAYGIEIGSENYNYLYPCTNIKILNNTVHDCHDAGISIGGYDELKSAATTFSEVRGNILYNNGLSGNDGANGEIHFEKCHDITVADNIVRNHDYSLPVIGCGKTSEHVKNVTFSNNLYAYDKPAKIIFSFGKNFYIGLEEWNKFTGGSDINAKEESK